MLGVGFGECIEQLFDGKNALVGRHQPFHRDFSSIASFSIGQKKMKPYKIENIPPLPPLGQFFQHLPGAYCKNCLEIFALYSYSAIRPDGVDEERRPFYVDCFKCRKIQTKGFDPGHYSDTHPEPQVYIDGLPLQWIEERMKLKNLTQPQAISQLLREYNVHGCIGCSNEECPVAHCPLCEHCSIVHISKRFKELKADIRERNKQFIAGFDHLEFPRRAGDEPGGTAGT